MANTFKFKGNKVRIRELKDVLGSQEIEKVVERQLLLRIADIVKRAEGNVNAQGGLIKSRYSKSYEKSKGKKQGVVVPNIRAVPNLTVTGEFLQSIQVGKYPNGGKLYFKGSHAGSKSKNKQQPSFPNSTLFKWLDAMGYKKWFLFSKKERGKIQGALSRKLRAVKKKLIVQEKI